MLHCHNIIIITATEATHMADATNTANCVMAMIVLEPTLN